MAQGARWRSTVAVTLTAAVLAGVGWAAARPTVVDAQFDIDQARSRLAEYIAANPPSPPGSDVPADGPPCPLATPQQVADAAGDVPVSVAPWYSYATVDAQLQSDVGDRVDVVYCVASPAAPGTVGVGMFALDIAPFDDAGLDFDRVARRFGVGRAAWTEPPTIGGDLAGTCFVAGARQPDLRVLWHRDGLVIGVDFTFPPGTERARRHAGRRDRHRRRARP